MCSGIDKKNRLLWAASVKMSFDGLSSESNLEREVLVTDLNDPHLRKSSFMAICYELLESAIYFSNKILSFCREPCCK